MSEREINVNTKHYIRVCPDLEIYYEVAGNGTTTIFIPCWAGKTECLEYQMAHFAKKYHAITYDPRSQGRTCRTLENNHYNQHGKDLKAFIDAFNFKNFVLVAHLWGCLDIYPYVPLFGTNNLIACTFIDDGPRAIVTQADDWSDFPDHAVVGRFINAIVYDYGGLLKELITRMTKRSMTPVELDWTVNQLLKSPNYAAALLAVDGSFADYCAEAISLDGKTRVLNILSEDQATIGEA